MVPTLCCMNPVGRGEAIVCVFYLQGNAAVALLEYMTVLPEEVSDEVHAC